MFLLIPGDPEVEDLPLLVAPTLVLDIDQLALTRLSQTCADLHHFAARVERDREAEIDADDAAEQQVLPVAPVAALAVVQGGCSLPRAPHAEWDQFRQLRALRSAGKSLAWMRVACCASRTESEWIKGISPVTTGSYQWCFLVNSSPCGSTRVNPRGSRHQDTFQ